jgi:uncharacterized DUF497 family protein
MSISFDGSKSDRNIALRGIPFDLATKFEWDTALIVEDVRQNYGERRFQALGRIDGRLYMLVFTPRKGATHVISLRKANEREVKRYEAQG